MTTEKNRKRKSTANKIAWGVFWLLIAALILSNYFGGFVELGFWSVVVAAFAVAILVHSLVNLAFAWIPIPIAALYYIFQAPLGFPFVPFWTVVVVTLLVTIGLHIILPRRFAIGKHFVHVWSDGKNSKKCIGVDIGDESDALVKESEDENNPTIEVQFGRHSRYLHSDNLTSADLRCNCGSLEVYFDHAQLNPEGARVEARCRLGTIELYIPGNWRVINNLSTSLGNAEIDGRLFSDDENAPLLTITGSVTLGNVEIHRTR